MVIYPNSEIYFLKNCPIAGDNQISFVGGSSLQQHEYFLGAAYIEPTIPGRYQTYPNVAFMSDSSSYARKDGYIEIKRNIADFAEVNYCIFKNHMPNYSAKPIMSKDAIAETSGRTSYQVSQGIPTQGQPKWFYSFVTNVEYVNPNTSRVYIKTDSWQTYQKDLTFTDCFIEREHIKKSDDVIGKHTYSENLDCGEMLYDSLKYIGMQSNNLVIDRDGQLATTCLIIASDDLTVEKTTDTTCSVTGGVPQCAYFYCFSDFVKGDGSQSHDVTAQGESIAGLMQLAKDNKKQDAVFCAVNIPSVLLGLSTLNIANLTGAGGYGALTVKEMQSSGAAKFSVKMPQTVSGYTPKNKKCLTYPYKYLTATDNTGNTISLLNEFTTTVGTFDFLVIGSGLAPDSSLMLIPDGTYKQGYAIGDTYPGDGTRSWKNNLQKAITITNFAQSAMISDLYAQWLGQNGAKNAISGVSGVLMAVLGIAAVATAVPSGGASLAAFAGSTSAIMGAGAAIGGVATVANSFASGDAASKLSDQFSSGMSSNGLHALACDFPKFYDTQCKAEYITNIDNYFTMFGYKVNRSGKCGFLTTPFRNKFNYCKTIGCSFYGSVPTTVLNEILAMFDNGIRLWQPQALTDFVQKKIGFNSDISGQGVDDINNS